MGNEVRKHLMKPLRTNLKFNKELKEYYVTVVTRLQMRLLKRSPPKKMLDKYAAMAEFMGLLVEETI